MLLLLIILVIFTNNVLAINVGNLRGKYSKNVKANYQISVPKKINENGEFVTHYLPHFYDISRPKRHLQGDSVNYLVKINNEEHHIQLWPSLDFITPSLVVEHHMEDVRDNINNIVIRQIRSNRCYYNGIVRNKPHSRAILSTCDGLTGSIKVNNDEHYLIEPALGDDQPIMDDQQLHLIYKRSDIGSSYHKNHTNCGTQGTYKESLKDRLKWENLYGEAVENSITRSLYKQIVDTVNENNKSNNENSREIRACRVCVETTTPRQLSPKEPICTRKSSLFLEMMVTIDYRIDRNWVHTDVESYIFTILNVVASNLADGSIGEPIKLNVVRLILLNYSYPQLDIFRFPPSKLLQNFCLWQMNFNPTNEYHPNHHDYALFITNFEPCQGHILGITNMASICRPDKSCAVVSDEGLLLSNIITHQIGHSLGADHDDGGTGGCAPEEPDGTLYHMGPIVSMSSSEWSICSRQCIAEFISTHAAWCLTDIPSHHDFIKPNILPGQIYSAVQQCSINFNMKTLACRVGSFCKKLFCQISPNQCASTGDPPAPGTPCAFQMWCFHGRCVHRGSRPGAVNGEWGFWSHWSPCTRSCGGGVQIRHRSCNNPAPLQGGRYCKGEYISFKMCSTNINFGIFSSAKIPFKIKGGVNHNIQLQRNICDNYSKCRINNKCFSLNNS